MKKTILFVAMATVIYGITGCNNNKPSKEDLAKFIDTLSLIKHYYKFQPKYIIPRVKTDGSDNGVNRLMENCISLYDNKFTSGAQSLNTKSIGYKKDELINWLSKLSSDADSVKVFFGFYDTSFMYSPIVLQSLKNEEEREKLRNSKDRLTLFFVPLKADGSELKSEPIFDLGTLAP